MEELKKIVENLKNKLIDIDKKIEYWQISVKYNVKEIGKAISEVNKLVEKKKEIVENIKKLDI